MADFTESLSHYFATRAAVLSYRFRYPIHASKKFRVGVEKLPGSAQTWRDLNVATI